MGYGKLLGLWLARSAQEHYRARRRGYRTWLFPLQSLGILGYGSSGGVGWPGCATLHGYLRPGRWFAIAHPVDGRAPPRPEKPPPGARLAVGRAVKRVSPHADTYRADFPHAHRGHGRWFTARYLVSSRGAAGGRRRLAGRSDARTSSTASRTARATRSVSAASAPSYDMPSPRSTLPALHIFRRARAQALARALARSGEAFGFPPFHKRRTSGFPPSAVHSSGCAWARCVAE